VLITDGARRGLLLPQVPVEHGWDRITFLEQTCRKASLPLNAWRNPQKIRIEAFTAEVFADAGCASS
jgi:AMMECR1 domain-containing protein